MSTQAIKVLHKTFEASGFDGTWIDGTIADGGAIFMTATKMFPDFPNCVWNATYQQIDFSDGSAIEFVASSRSMFNTTYRAC
jgi:hypothetical protein